MKRDPNYPLPDRFTVNRRELLKVTSDKEAEHLFGNGERMATRTALELNKIFLDRLKAATPERHHGRLLRKPDMAEGYERIVEWGQQIIRSPEALLEATGIDNEANLAAEVEVDPLGERPADMPGEEAGSRKDQSLDL